MFKKIFSLLSFVSVLMPAVFRCDKRLSVENDSVGYLFAGKVCVEYLVKTVTDFFKIAGNQTGQFRHFPADIPAVDYQIFTHLSSSKKNPGAIVTPGKYY